MMTQFESNARLMDVNGRVVSQLWLRIWTYDRWGDYKYHWVRKLRDIPQI